MNHRVWLAAGALAALVATTGCSTPITKAGEWRALEYELEHAPLYQNPLAFEFVFDGLVEAGFSPRKARLYLRRAARFGPNVSVLLDLIEENKENEEGVEALSEAIELAHADAIEGRRASPRLRAYHHLGVDGSRRTEHWNKLAIELAAAPIYDNPLSWKQTYIELVNLGFSPKSARMNIRRAARFGPRRAEFRDLMDEYKDKDVADLQVALNLANSAALDERWEADKSADGYVRYVEEDELAEDLAPQVIVPEDTGAAEEDDEETEEPAAVVEEEFEDDPFLDDPDMEFEDDPDFEDEPDLDDEFGGEDLEEDLDDDPTPDEEATPEPESTPEDMPEDE